jgi:hypothetical protein
MKAMIGAVLVSASLLVLLAVGSWGEEGGDRPLPCRSVDSWNDREGTPPPPPPPCRFVTNGR